MVVHQLVPTFAAGDATCQSAIHLQLVLRRLGHYGEIYSGEIKDGLGHLIRPERELHPSSEDLVLYHHGIASGMSARLMHLRCRRGVVFHNISPAHFYPNTSLLEGLRTGRAQLAAMARHVDVALGDSDFNSAELREARYSNVHTVPLFVEPERFAASGADPHLLKKLAGRGPVVLAVSRVLPHKRFEDLIALHRELLKSEPTARLLLVGGFEKGDRYFRRLGMLATGLPGIHFLGRLTHAELVAAYRSAQLFVSMSEHEGFGVPLIEAMAAEVPVLAYGAAAVPETLGGAGVGFAEKNFAFLAELARELCAKTDLRRRVLLGQARRLTELSAEVTQRRLEEALETVLPRAPRRPSPPRRRPRVGVVVQRFGEVTGGAELLASQVAQRLSAHAEVTVLTSCAADHLTWTNVFPEGEQRVGGLRVLRFLARPRQDLRRFNALSRRLFGAAQDRIREEQWVAEQGPVMPGLFRHLAEEKDAYDAFIGFTYLYAPMALGLPLVASRALVVPTAHDEPALAFDVFSDVFERPRALFCSTPEEAALVSRRFPHHARSRVVGVGVDGAPGQGPSFVKKFSQARPYLLFVGRIEKGKGIPELLRHHARLRARDDQAPDLLLAGHSSLRVSRPGVRMLGRISDEDKRDALAGAVATVIPSRYESLSLLALESLAQGTPILVNGESAVLEGQVNRSGAGAIYRDPESFAAGLSFIRTHRSALSRKGRAFAQRHSWDKVISIYREEISRIMRTP